MPTPHADLDTILVAMLPILAVVAGILFCWYDGSRQQSATGTRRPPVGFSILGGFLLIAGILGAVIGTTLLFAVVAVPAVAVVIIVFIRRYYNAEQQSLMWVLLTAAERGIPLHIAAQSFADEQSGVSSGKAAQLADYLEAGLPLGLALRRSGYRIDAAVSLAADLGYQTGTLGQALRQVLERTNVLEAVTVPMASRMVYLGVTVLNTLIVQSFLMLHILPRLERMHYEFHIALPASTKSLLAISEWDSPEFFLAVAFIAVGLFGLLFGLSSVFGTLRSMPLVRRLWWRVDCSLVMRWLSTGVGQQRPILDTVRLLSGYFPQASMRRALENAARRIEQGVHWCDSLWRAGLIRRSDSAVFKAAERAGNLQWALQEMSESSVRRWAYKLQVWINFLFPIVLIVLSGGVLAVVLGFFTPIITLIQGQL